MGIAKYFEDNMEIIEERHGNYRSSYYESNYNSNNTKTNTRKIVPPSRPVRTSYYIVFNGKRIAV